MKWKEVSQFKVFSSGIAVVRNCYLILKILSDEMVPF